MSPGDDSSSRMTETKPNDALFFNSNELNWSSDGGKTSLRGDIRLHETQLVKMDAADGRFQVFGGSRLSVGACLLDFVEAQRRTRAQTGAETGQKREFLWEQTCLSSLPAAVFPFVCALIVEPSLFRRAALFMLQSESSRALTRARASAKIPAPRQPRLSRHQAGLLSGPIPPYLSAPP